MLFILYRLGRFLALHLPLRVGYFFATFIATVYYLFSENDSQAVKANLKVLFPHYDDAKLNNMAGKVFVNFGKYLIDFFRFSKIDKDYIDRYVKVEDLHYLEDALKEKKGVILVTAHLGNWELGGVVVSALGFPFNAVVLNHKNPKVNRFFIRQRQMKGIEVIPIGSALRRCFRALRENKVLALVGDRDYFDNGIKTVFFGKSTLIPKGPAVFSRRFGSPIVPVFMIRNDDDTFVFKFYEPIKSTNAKDELEDIADTTRKFIRVLEKVIREYPSQWHVFRRFWERIGWERRSL